MAATNVLIKRIENVTSAGQSYKNSHLLKDRKDEIEKSFLPAYQTMTVKFDKVLSAYKDLSKIRNITVDFKLIKDSVIILKNKVLHDEYDKPLAYFVIKELGSIETKLSDDWQLFIKEKTDSIAGVLESLNKLIAGTPEKQKLDTKRAIFLSSSIGSPAAVAAIQDYIDTYNALINKLQLKNSVLSFLKLLTSDKPTTLNNLDDEVYQWIKQSGFAGMIALSIGLGK